MRVLVTGGAGRLGVIVCQTFLDAGYKVRVFDLDSPQNRRNLKKLHPGENVEVCWGDITQPHLIAQGLNGVDAIVHMAAVLPPLADKRPELAYKVNVGGTGNLVKLVKELPQPVSFVFTSSVAVFGCHPQPHQPLCPEKTPPQPIDTYGKTKLAAEDLIRESGIDFVILRLTATMYLDFTIADIKRMFSAPPETPVEFCHPRDAATAIVNAVRDFDMVKGNTLVISGGPDQRMSYGEMVGAILGLMGLPLPPREKFSSRPFYLHWYDTARAQALLAFQRHSFTDYLKDLASAISRKYGPGFLGFMKYVVSPVLGKVIVQFF
jgi:UDP-glucose 4-epimerase